MKLFNRINKPVSSLISLVSTLLMGQVVYAEVNQAKVNQAKVNESVEKNFQSVLQMFDGSQIGTRYTYTETKGVETANKAQWRARLNFTYVFSKDEQGVPQWRLRAISGTGGKFDSGTNDLAGVSKGARIKEPNTDFYLKNIWIEYNWDSQTAQFGALETLPVGFTQGFDSLDSNGWVKGARYIKNNMEVLGLKVDRLEIMAGRSEDFDSPMATDGWGTPNYYDITVEARPIDKLKIAISNSVFTGMKPEDVIDYSPRIYAEYNTAEIFKDIIDSVAVDTRFHTKGQYPIQRIAVGLNKKIKEGPMKDWSGQIAYADSFTEDMYVPMNAAMFSPNPSGKKQGKQLGLALESPALAKPFGISEVRLYARGRIGLGDDKSDEDNKRAEFGINLIEVAPKDMKTSHIFQRIEDEMNAAKKAAEHIGN
jgi:hypothetical protein